MPLETPLRSSEEPRRFQYPLSSGILLVLAIAANFRSPPALSNVPYAIGYHFGAAASIIAIPVVLTWLLYRIFRLRKTGTVISAWVLSSLVLLGQVEPLASSRAKEREKNNAQLQGMEAEIRAQQKTLFNEQASVSQRAAAASKTVDALQNAGTQMSGEDGKLMRAMSEAIQELGIQSKDYYSLVTSFETSPILATSTLRDVAEIETRIARVNAFKAANEKMRATSRDLPDRMSEAVKKSGVSMKAQSAALDGFLQKYSPQLPLVMKMRALDDELADEMLNALGVLRDHWGKWHHNNGERLIFEEDTALKLFNSCIENLQKIAGQQSEIQAQIAQITSR